MGSETVVGDVLFDNGFGVTFLTVVSDAEGAATLDLSGGTNLGILVVALFVFALTSPFSKIFSGGNSNEWDLVLLGESSDELLIFGIITIFSQNTQECVLSVESLANLVQSFYDTISSH